MTDIKIRATVIAAQSFSEFAMSYLQLNVLDRLAQAQRFYEIELELVDAIAKSRHI